ncbi:MAG: response regulator [Ignavibacteriales bacterium]|nr:response regulator [Ignavibacteriales bacterium]
MNKKIVVIEDNREIAQNISVLLKDRGYDVYTYFAGTEGLKTIIEQEPAIILCDIMLPDISGYKIFNETKKLVKQEPPIFIFITAKTQREDLRKGMELGADDYLTKPFTFNELLNSINVQVKKREKITGIIGNNKIVVDKKNGEEALSYDDHIFIDDKKSPGFYLVSDIVSIKSMKDYTRLSLSGERKFVLRKPLSYWERKLPPGKFLRIHRQTIVNLSYIEKVENISSNRYRLILRANNETYEVSQRSRKKIKTLAAHL